eukprot:PITA_01108
MFETYIFSNIFTPTLFFRHFLHLILMGNPATHFLAFTVMVVVVLMLQCLHMGSARRLERQNYHTVPAKFFNKLKEEQGVAECSASPADQETLKPGVKITLSHIHGACSPLKPTNSSSWKDFVSQTLERDNIRLNTIRSRTSRTYSPLTDVPLQPGSNVGGESYILTAGFGTPAKNQLLLIDTGSDVTWIQCSPCSHCYSQVDPVFDPEQSSSYRHLSCDAAACTELTTSEGNDNTCSNGGCVYEVRYGDGSITQGDFSQETFTLGSDSFQSFEFGCAHSTTGLFAGSAGLLGLGRTPLAFPSQTNSKYGGQFSYCLPDFGSSSSTGSFSVGEGSIPATAVFTPLVSNPISESFYFVGLSGISVGDQRLSFTPAIIGTAGTIVDSGTVITRLVPQVYSALRDSFLSQTQDFPRAQPYEDFLDTCYDLSRSSQVQIPGITFHFQNNADVRVSAQGTLLTVESDGSQVCLAFAPESGSNSVNIIGNFQQQQMKVAFDTAGGRLGFTSGSCAT